MVAAGGSLSLNAPVTIETPVTVAGAVHFMRCVIQRFCRFATTTRLALQDCCTSSLRLVLLALSEQSSPWLFVRFSSHSKMVCLLVASDTAACAFHKVTCAATAAVEIVVASAQHAAVVASGQCQCSDALLLGLDL